MQSRRFQIGQKVSHIGGGAPTMAVIGYDEIEGETYVLCRWWDQSSKDYKKELFLEPELTDPPSTSGRVYR